METEQAQIDPTLRGSLAMLAGLEGWNMAVTQEPDGPIVVAFTEREETDDDS